ncbi:hypothetical protein V7201_03810 [Bacillus sp. JJ1122]
MDIVPLRFFVFHLYIHLLIGNLYLWLVLKVNVDWSGRQSIDAESPETPLKVSAWCVNQI